MLLSLKAWLAPEARRERRRKWKMAWQEAHVQAAHRRDHDHPRPEGFFDRIKGPKP